MKLPLVATLPADSVAAARAELIADVRAGLGHPGPKTLPPKYLYDDVGSALFEAISRLPEYGLTRADERILRSAAPHIVGRLELPVLVAELGSGSGRKTRWILQALARRQETTYFPIDISAAALAQCERELGRLPGVRWIGLERDYSSGVAEVVARRGRDQRVLVLFLGSTIGNFERTEADAFLRQLRRALAPGDALLLGTDLEKPIARLLPAYDDPGGSTAAFNRNLLVRMNRELGADFDPARFEHEVRWSAAERRIEIRLRATSAQRVRIPAADLEVTFAAGEALWTENSHKYAEHEAVEIARRTGFRCEGEWVDREWPFAESLLIAH